MSNSINGSRPESRETPAHGLGSVLGYPSVIQRLRSIVIHPVSSAWAGTPGVVAPSGVLIYGPPGDAAAALRVAVADELAVEFVDLNMRSPSPDIAGQRVILLEGLDELAGAGAKASSVGRRAALGIAELFDQVSRLPPVERPLTIATSVAPWHLDPRWFGSGRLDRLAFVPPPGWEARTIALEAGARHRGLPTTGRISLLAAATVGWSGADLVDLLDELDAEAGGATSEVGPSSLLLDVVSRIVPRTRSWSGRAREMAERWTGDGMIDDLVAWLRRAE